MRKYTIIILGLILTVLFISVKGYSQSSELKIRFPSEAGAKAMITGYNYLKNDTIGMIDLNTQGEGVLKHNYIGFALITVAGTRQYPIIINKGYTTIELIPGSKTPKFGNCKDNAFLYRTLIAKEELMRKRMTIDEALESFDDNDPFRKSLIAEKEKLSTKEISLNKNIKDSSVFYVSALLMQAKELMETTYGIKTEAELKDRKNAFLTFINKNIKTLRYSDMIQQLAGQYVMMNEYVIIGQNNHYNQVLVDVEDWIKKFGKSIGSKQIAEHFMNIYAGRSMYGVAGRIAERFHKETACKINTKTFELKGDKKSIIIEAEIKNSKAGDNTIKLKNIPSQYKILIYHSNKCSASYVQNIMLSRYTREKMIQVPVITVFVEGESQDALSRFSKIKPDAFYYSESNSLFKVAGITQVPSYVILNKGNVIEKKFVSLEKMKAYLENVTK